MTAHRRRLSVENFDQSAKHFFILSLNLPILQPRYPRLLRLKRVSHLRVEHVVACVQIWLHIADVFLLNSLFHELHELETVTLFRVHAAFEVHYFYLTSI